MPSFEPTSNGTTEPYDSYYKTYQTSIGAASDLVELGLRILASPLFCFGSREESFTFDIYHIENCQKNKQKILSEEEWASLIHEWFVQGKGKSTIKEQVNALFTSFQAGYPMASRHEIPDRGSPNIHDVDDCSSVLCAAAHVATELERVYNAGQASA